MALQFASLVRYRYDGIKSVLFTKKKAHFLARFRVTYKDFCCGQRQRKPWSYFAVIFLGTHNGFIIVYCTQAALDVRHFLRNAFKLCNPHC